VVAYPVAAVALAHDQRQRPAPTSGEAVEEHAQSTVADRGQPVRLELVADLREVGVVAALPRQVVVGEQRAEPVVDAVEVDLRELDQVVPQPQRVRVPGLQRDHPAPGPLGEVVRLVEGTSRGLVERIGVVGQGPGRLGVLADVDEVLDQHPERRTPVADVVLPDHPMAEVLEDSGQRVADDRRTQVADVHLLGDVGRGVVDDHDLRILRRYAEPRVAREYAGRLTKPLRPQHQIDEPRPADLRRPADRIDVERGHQVPGDLARRPAEPPGQRESHVGLEVGVLRGPDQRVDIGVLRAEGDRDRAPEPLLQRLLGTHGARLGRPGAGSRPAAILTDR